MEPRRAPTAWTYLPGSNRIVYQPLGVIGIISAWNYPLLVTLSPLIGALAAGNRTILKPSEIAPRTAAALAAMIAEAYPSDQVHTVNGGADLAARFAGLPFDHIVFTGSTRVGKVIMREASENLTPVTLELGGKSPAIIHESYPLATAVNRIVGGKLLNAGQTCIAPDYVLAPRARVDAFVEGALALMKRLYPKLAAGTDYTRIINGNHYHRLAGYLADAASKGAVLHRHHPSGEACNEENRVLAPTILTGVNDAMTVMQDEIFGPILPVIPYGSIEDAIDFVNARPRPLALYYFDNNRKRADTILSRTCSGGVTLNGVILHIAQNDLPFGGIGPSGMGSYHGFDGFERFSHKKAVHTQGRIAALDLFRPPYTSRIRRFIDAL